MNAPTSPNKVLVAVHSYSRNLRLVGQFHTSLNLSEDPIHNIKHIWADTDPEAHVAVSHHLTRLRKK
jgi:hypothetical protein